MLRIRAKTLRRIAGIGALLPIAIAAGCGDLLSASSRTPVAAETQASARASASPAGSGDLPVSPRPSASLSLPDLTIGEIRHEWEVFGDCVSPDTAILAFKIEIRNVGTADADPFEVNVADTPIGFFDEGLGAGMSRELVIDWIDLYDALGILVQPGMRVSVDWLDDVRESDDENNESHLVATLPDGLSICPQEPEPSAEGERLPLPLLTAGQPLNMLSLEMFDERTGWGIAGEEGQNRHILRTEDGGRTWIDVSPPELVSQVRGFGKPATGQFIDWQTAWVSYPEVDFDRRLPGGNHLWKTVDGGRTWQYSAIVHRSPYYLDSDEEHGPSIYPVDAQYAWAKVITIWQPRCGDWELFRTTDGGETWQYLREDRFYCPDSGMDFLGRDHIWRIEHSNFNVVPELRLSQSHDGGRSWQTTSLPLPGDESAIWRCEMSSPSLQSLTRGTVEVSCSTNEGVGQRYSYSTNDGGKTWQIRPIEHGDPEYVSPGQAWVLEPAMGEQGESPSRWDLSWTYDGGRTWTAAGTLGGEADIDFISSQVGWAVVRPAEGGAQLLTTGDGGRSWEEIRPVVAAGRGAIRPAPPRVSLPSELQLIQRGNLDRLEVLQALPVERVSALAFLPPQNVLVTGHQDGMATFWLLDGKSYPSVTRLHSDWIYAIAGSEEELVFATASKDDALKIWGLFGVGEVANIAGFGGEVSSVSVRADGATLASGSQDGLVRTWDLDHYYPEGASEALMTFSGHRAWVWDVAFAPDGRTLASGSSDRTVRIWDAESGQELAGPLIHGATVGSLAFSPDGRRLATGAWNGSVFLWDTETWSPLSQSGEHSSRVHVVRFAPDGSLLASGAANGSLILWNPGSGEPLRILQAGEGAVRSLAFSPDGSLLVTSSDDGMLRFWGVRP